MLPGGPPIESTSRHRQGNFQGVWVWRLELFYRKLKEHCMSKSQNQKENKKGIVSLLVRDSERYIYMPCALKASHIPAVTWRKDKFNYTEKSILKYSFGTTVLNWRFWLHFLEGNRHSKQTIILPHIFLFQYNFLESYKS